MNDEKSINVENQSSEIANAEELGYLSYRQLIWRRLRGNRMGLAAAIVL